MKTKTRLDATDRKILAEMQADAGQSLDEIARKVGSSKTPVWNRIKKMREAGVMSQPMVHIRPEALGLEECFFVLITRQDNQPPVDSSYW